MLNVQLRDTETFKPDDIEKKVNQELEIFTYLLIDRNNYTVSYLKEQSAPSITVLQYLIDNNYKQKHELLGEISGVIVDDAIPLLKKKDTLGTLTYRVSIPSEKLISIDALGLTEKEFTELKNQKHAEIQVKLVAERNKTAFKDPNGFEKVIKKIMSFTSKASIRAKDKDGYMQTYNIVEDQLTKKVKFDFNRENVKIQDEIYSNLKIVYEGNREEILDYIGKE